MMSSGNSDFPIEERIKLRDELISGISLLKEFGLVHDWKSAAELSCSFYRGPACKKYNDFIHQLDEKIKDISSTSQLGHLIGNFFNFWKSIDSNPDWMKTYGPLTSRLKTVHTVVKGVTKSFIENLQHGNSEALEKLIAANEKPVELTNAPMIGLDYVYNSDLCSLISALEHIKRKPNFDQHPHKDSITHLIHVYRSRLSAFMPDVPEKSNP